MKQHQDHQCNKLLKEAIIWPLFFFFITFNIFATEVLKIAIVDTGFCIEKIGSNKKIKLLNSVDLTNSVNINCKATPIFDPRLHGELVLEEFIKNLNIKEKIEIHPIIIFDKFGNQKIDYWKRANQYIKDHGISFVLTASGLILRPDEKLEIEFKFNSIWFAPSGRIGQSVKRETILFPQVLAPRENLFLIGDYYDGNISIYDQGLLYQKVIDYCFPSGSDNLRGTSRAVAVAASKALNICSHKLQWPTIFRQCLKEKRQILKDHFNHLEIPTF